MARKKVVSATALRVVVGGEVVPLEPGVPREVSGRVYQAALDMGASPAEEAPAPLHHEPEPAPLPQYTIPPRPVDIDPPDPVPKRKRGPKGPMVKTLVKFIAEQQEYWDEADYNANGVPRMTLFTGKFPNLTTEKRDKAWEHYVDTMRQ